MTRIYPLQLILWLILFSLQLAALVNLQLLNLVLANIAAPQKLSFSYRFCFKAAMSLQRLCVGVLRACLLFRDQRFVRNSDTKRNVALQLIPQNHEALRIELELIWKNVWLNSLLKIQKIFITVLSSTKKTSSQYILSGIFEKIKV